MINWRVQYTCYRNSYWGRKTRGIMYTWELTYYILIVLLWVIFAEIHVQGVRELATVEHHQLRVARNYFYGPGEILMELSLDVVVARRLTPRFTYMKLWIQSGQVPMWLFQFIWSFQVYCISSCAVPAHTLVHYYISRADGWSPLRMADVRQGDYYYDKLTSAHDFVRVEFFDSCVNPLFLTLGEEFPTILT